MASGVLTTAQLDELEQLARLEPTSFVRVHPTALLELVRAYRDELREALSNCDKCMAAVCAECGHEPCPACVDDCDDAECIVWNDETGAGTKTHVCVFARCPEHRQLELVK